MGLIQAISTSSTIASISAAADIVLLAKARDREHILEGTDRARPSG